MYDKQINTDMCACMHDFGRQKQNTKNWAASSKRNDIRIKNKRFWLLASTHLGTFWAPSSSCLEAVSHFMGAWCLSPTQVTSFCEDSTSPESCTATRPLSTREIHRASVCSHVCAHLLRWASAGPRPPTTAQGRSRAVDRGSQRPIVPYSSPPWDLRDAKLDPAQPLSGSQRCPAGQDFHLVQKLNLREGQVMKKGDWPAISMSHPTSSTCLHPLPPHSDPTRKPPACSRTGPPTWNSGAHLLPKRVTNVVPFLKRQLGIKSKVFPLWPYMQSAEPGPALRGLCVLLPTHCVLPDTACESVKGLCRLLFGTVIYT